MTHLQGKQILRALRILTGIGAGLGLLLFIVTGVASLFEPGLMEKLGTIPLEETGITFLLAILFLFFSL